QEREQDQPSERDGPSTEEDPAPLAPLPLSTTSTTSSPSLRNALRGLTVVVMHVKETMVDGPLPGDVILEELWEHERAGGLGVEFVVSRAGAGYLF
ncbi:uncharacterized protein B0H64DRAFT_395313, partial [Chaetomium fimeti]